MSALDTAKAKLVAVGQIKFEDLPTDRQSTLWTAIYAAHTAANTLTLGEMSALENVASHGGQFL
jgi:hypothetical protein